MKHGLQRITLVIAVAAVCTVLFFFMSFSNDRSSVLTRSSGDDGSMPQRERPKSPITKVDDDEPAMSPPTPIKEEPPQRAEASPPRGDTSHADDAAYHAFFLTLAENHYGPLLFRALFDREALNAAATALKGGTNDQSVLRSDLRYTWNIALLRQRPVTPECFRTPADILHFSKLMLSIGLGRFARDAQLGRLHQRAVALGTLPLFTRQVRKILTAYASYFHTMLQLAIDSMDGPVKDALHTLQQRDPTHADPLTVLMADVTHKTRPEEVATMLQDTAGIAAKQQRLAAAAATGGGAPGGGTQQQAASPSGSIAAMFPLEYNMGHFDAQRPSNGKFWNMIRPTASCSSLVRLCEVPDGCRLLCNAEYLMEAGLGAATTQSKKKGRKHYHRIAGFGSNNEYDWETSLHRMFQKSATLTGGAHHAIGWVTVFDCTLGSGRRGWAPPKELTASAIGFGHVTKCCDAEPSDKSVTVGLTKALLLKSEQERLALAAEAPLPSTGELVTRYTVAKGALKQSARQTKPTAEAAGTVRIFDDLTILKLDIEGYEFNVLPKWGRDELRCLGAQQQGTGMFAPGSTAHVDFGVDCSDYFAVSLLSMEFHRSGHKQEYGARLPGALRAHYTLLHAYSLGYVMVGQERNHQDNCCFEVALVHQRHFVRSEMWMLVGDALF